MEQKDIDKKIAADDLLIRDGGLSKEGYRNMAERLIKELKACREWRSTQEQGVHEVVEQRTKEACKEKICEEIVLSLDACHKAGLRDALVAIDEVGEKT